MWYTSSCSHLEATRTNAFSSEHSPRQMLHLGRSDFSEERALAWADGRPEESIVRSGASAAILT